MRIAQEGPVFYIYEQEPAAENEVAESQDESGRSLRERAMFLKSWRQKVGRDWHNSVIGIGERV